jgi:DNA topoisomerase-3
LPEQSGRLRCEKIFIMSKSLVIAEKPSVARDLAKSLGKFTSKDDFFDDSLVITSAVGHLVELCLPNEMDKARQVELCKSPDRSGSLRSQANRKIRFPPESHQTPAEARGHHRGHQCLRRGPRRGVDFHYIIQLANSKKPTRRLWLQSMTAEAIREGFANLRAGKEMVPLADAAVCRSESDWLVGINATRAMTAFNSKGGGFQRHPSRPRADADLAILAEREEKIRAFKPRPYFEVYADFGVSAGSYRGAGSTRV